MTRWLVLLPIALLGWQAGCLSDRPRQRVDPVAGYTVPLEWDKAVDPPGQFNAPVPLREDVLYVADANDLAAGQPPDAYYRHGMWYRFWRNGRAIEKSWWDKNPAEPATAANADDFRRAVGWFYSLKGTYLALQTVVPNDNEQLLGDARRFYTERGQINEDGSFTLEFETKPAGALSRRETKLVTFRPVKVDGSMKRRPDW